MESIHAPECPARSLTGSQADSACLCPMLAACAARVTATITSALANMPYTHLNFITRTDAMAVIATASRQAHQETSHQAANANKGTSTPDTVNEDNRHMNGDRP